MAAGDAKILVVDDDKLQREYLTQLLAEFGFSDIVDTGSIAESKEALEEYYPDILFLDVELGDDNGLDLLPDLRAINPDTQIVMVSAHSSVENAKMAIANGAKGYVVKPFTPRKLIGIMKKIGVEVDASSNGGDY